MVAHAIHYLASARASFVTGSEAVVDGGLTAAGVAWMRGRIHEQLGGCAAPA